MRKVQIDNTLEALEALPEGAKLTSRHGDTLTVEHGALRLDWGSDAFTLPFAHRYVLDENVNVLDVWLPEEVGENEEIDATGCIVYVVAQDEHDPHGFEVGQEVEVVVDHYGSSQVGFTGRYDCRGLGDDRWMVWLVDATSLDTEPPPELPVPLHPTDSTCVGDLEGLEALPNWSVVLCPDSERSWVRRGSHWVTLLDEGLSTQALVEFSASGVFYRSPLVVVLHHAVAEV